jgi:acetylglutamate kinase
MTLDAFAGRWFVVKLGGELAQDPARLAATVGAPIRQFLDAGVKVAVVHGGGAQATELSKRVGLVTTQVAGQRVTDEATLLVMKQAVAGQVSVDIARAFRLAQVSALCTSGVSAGLVDATRRPPVEVDGQRVDYGLVGDISAVNVRLLEALAGEGVVPVLACLAGDARGQVYNVNADTVAAKLAGRLSAAKLLLVSTVPGVLTDKSDGRTRLPSLTRRQADELIANRTIVGGMIPKVTEALEMLDEGVDSVHIVGTTPDTALLDEVLTAGSCGTVFVRGR